MKTNLFSLAISLLACSINYAQTKIPVKVFHNHIQLCHYVGTTEEDYTVELFSDSTIVINLYRSNYRDGYNSLTKESYSGKYSSKGDTFIASELLPSIEKKYKKALRTGIETKHPFVVRHLVKLAFTLQGDLLVSDDATWNGLRKSSALQALVLTNRFNEWGITSDRDSEEKIGLKLFKPR